MKLNSRQIEEYKEQGYLLMPGLFTTQEAGGLRDHFMAVNASGPKPGDFGGDPNNSADPLNKYPRLLNMHNWDLPTKQTATDARVLSILQQLINDVPVVNQTMLYFKPPLSRGQALHQDQQWITIEPLIGLWLALDDSDQANGHMVFVPGSPRLGLLPAEPADPNVSWTGGQAKLPQGLKTVGIDMKAGDALFFDGKTIHGSYPNTTKDRFRRCFICHYVGVNSKHFTPPEGTHMSSLAKAAATP
jgi:phytanoyl-CoA hydroxylase